MKGNLEICRDCVYCISSNRGPICKVTGVAPAFNIICRNFTANDAEHNRYIAACRSKIINLEEKAEHTVNVGTIIGCVATIAALCFCYFGGSNVFMTLAMVFAVATFLIVIKRYAAIQDKITQEKCALHSRKIYYSVNEVDTTDHLLNPAITIEGIVQHIKDLGYSPVVDKQDGTTWVLFMYGRFRYHLTYEGDRLFIATTLSREVINNLSDPAFLIAANNMMLQIAHVRVYIDQQNFTFDLFSHMRYMDELRSNFIKLVMMIEQAIDAHVYYYNSVIEDSIKNTNDANDANDQDLPTQPMSDMVN